MRDGVAEVLRERSALDRPDASGVVASLSLHALVIAALVFGARQSVGRADRVVTIQLASGASLPRSVSPSAPPAAPAAAKKPAAEPPVTPAPLPPPVAAPEKVKPEAAKDPSLFGKDKPAKTSGRSNPAAPASPSRASSATSPSSGTVVGALPAVGTAGVAGLEGGDFPYDVYINRMLAIIGRNWFRPSAAGEPLAQVYFVIERNGAVRDVKIEKESGNSTFDRAAMRAIIESSPLPPLPFAYAGNYLGVHLTFH